MVMGNPEGFIGHTVVQLAHLLGRELDRRLASLGLSATGFSALFHLARQPQLSAAALARRILITPQSVGPLLDGLADGGLVQRRRDGGPGTPITTRLTEAGGARLAEALERVRALDDEVAGGLGAEDRERLAAHLLQLLAAAEQLPDAAGCAPEAGSPR